MSHNLWRFLLEDDVDSFRQYLAHATYSSVTSKAPASGPVGGSSFKIGSPGTLATSPRTPLKTRKSPGNITTTSTPNKNVGPILTRADVNSRDSFARTILHHAASLRSQHAQEFVRALLEVPFVDLYAQDQESGWTALHRALYFGNVSVAQALMHRDLQDAIDYTTSASHLQAGGLIKIKDHEGNSPFEVFGLTIAPRILQTDTGGLPAGTGDDDSTNSVDFNDEGNDQEKSKRSIRPIVDLQGDEVFAFGSNKNLTLGIGDSDDRHFPERLHFKRPDHLLHRIYEDHVTERQKNNLALDLTSNVASVGVQDEIPAVVRNKAITVQDVVMSKFHTAVLTNDPISNLFICGFGAGGRLGTGDETTSFTYKCIQGGGLAKRKISAIALGQDHSVAISSHGEVFTWGSNRYGQLGYALPEVSAKEGPVQLLPRQLYGYIKKELIIGTSASSIHSAIFTSTALYTFGKNDGQLGLMDADARSLEMQILPRRIAPSILQFPIRSVSAIDRATTVLLDNDDVIVFTHYGWTKVLFQLEGFTNYFISDALTTRYKMESNSIQQVTSGGNTICARSSFGEVYTIEVPRVSDMVPPNVSTTNPNKIRNALPQPNRVWSIRKAHMAAIDAAVGQDGSIILCTASGAVWRKEKRANIKSVHIKDNASGKSKDYKFVRVPNLTRAVTVRSNAFGAFTAVRKDCDVTREQITVDPPALWENMFPLLPFSSYGAADDDEISETPQLRFWRSISTDPSPASIKRAIIMSPDSEADLQRLCSQHEPLADSQYDLLITSNVTDVRIPIHSFLIKGRSRAMRIALREFQQAYYYTIPDVMSIQYGSQGQIEIQFQGVDFLTIANLVFYLYTDNVIDVWHFTSQALQSAARYRLVRTELMKIASHLELRQLENAVRAMIDPVKSLTNDLETAVIDSDLFSDADVVIELVSGAELMAHSALLCARCPFFEGLFHGRAAGRWMSSRLQDGEEKPEATRVDLKHIEEKVFKMVLRHLYADTGVELFDDIVTSDLEAFIDLVIDVLSVANELMIDRLALVCQNILGKFVTTRNVCRLLNIVSECSVNEFKYAALEYICLNLESMMEHRLLEELEPELLVELDEIVQQNQLAYMPFARSERAQGELLEKHPELLDQIDQARQRRIDSMRLRSRLFEDEQRTASQNKFRVGSFERQNFSPINQRTPPLSIKEESSATSSPVNKIHDNIEDLPFDMDEDGMPGSPTNYADLPSPSIGPMHRKTQELLTGSFGSSSDIRRQDSIIGENKLSIGASLSESPYVEKEATPVSGFEAPKVVWQGSSKTMPKTGLKDIMAQASASSQISGITQAINKASVGPTKSAPKLSQKERKKQQQQQSKKQESTTKEDIAIANPAKLGPSQSPWKSLAHSGQASSSSNPAPKSEKTQSPILSARPGLTIRQTVAGRSASSETVPTKTNPAGPVSGSLTVTNPAPPKVQSIRHIPLPPRSSSGVDAHSSMADILAQQQIEKSVVKEAALKRPLEDIQQEQAFQEWWDNESRKVQEEEAQARAVTNRRGRGGRGRGQGLRKGSSRGRGETSTDAVGQSVNAERTTSAVVGNEHQKGSGKAASRSGQRGDGQGRGRGAGRSRGQNHQAAA